MADTTVTRTDSPTTVDTSAADATHVADVAHPDDEKKPKRTMKPYQLPRGDTVCDVNNIICKRCERRVSFHTDIVHEPNYQNFNRALYRGTDSSGKTRIWVQNACIACLRRDLAILHAGRTDYRQFLANQYELEQKEMALDATKDYLAMLTDQKKNDPPTSPEAMKSLLLAIRETAKEIEVSIRRITALKEYVNDARRQKKSKDYAGRLYYTRRFGPATYAATNHDDDDQERNLLNFFSDPSLYDSVAAAEVIEATSFHRPLQLKNKFVFTKIGRGGKKTIDSDQDDNADADDAEDVDNEDDDVQSTTSYTSHISHASADRDTYAARASRASAAEEVERPKNVYAKKPKAAPKPPPKEVGPSARDIDIAASLAKAGVDPETIYGLVPSMRPRN